MKLKVLIFTIIQLSIFNIYAQNLEDSLGGVKTDFCFFSDTTNLNVTNQMIIQRAEKNLKGNATNGIGMGYGYQSLHIEFIAREQIIEKEYKYRTGRNNKDKLELIFYGQDNAILASCITDYSVVDLMYNSSSAKKQFFYSIDLIDIPIVLLNQTMKINMIKKVAKRKR